MARTDFDMLRRTRRCGAAAPVGRRARRLGPFAGAGSIAIVHPKAASFG